MNNRVVGQLGRPYPLGVSCPALWTLEHNIGHRQRGAPATLLTSWQAEVSNGMPRICLRVCSHSKAATAGTLSVVDAETTSRGGGGGLLLNRPKNGTPMYPLNAIRKHLLLPQEYSNQT